MPRQKIKLNTPFQGLVTSQDPAQLALGQASDANNVYTSDGSIRSRLGYDLLNTSVPAYTCFDNFLRDNSITLGDLTSSDAGGNHTWGGSLNGYHNGSIRVWKELSVYNGRARGANDGTADLGITCGNVLFDSTGAVNPLSLGDQTIEFLLRKHQGQGTVANSFVSGEVETTCTFAVHLRCTDATELLETNADSENDYHVEFDIPCGPYDNDCIWDDIVVRVYKQTASAGRTQLVVQGTYTGSDEAPGVDEWIPIKITISGTSTTTIQVYINGTLRVTETDSSSPHTANGFLKLRMTSGGSASPNWELKRQVEIASFRAYTGSESDDPCLNVEAYSDESGTDYLVSKHRNNVLTMRNNVAVGAGSLAFTSPELVKVNRRNGHLGYDSTTTTWNNAIVTYDQGSETFLITDPYTGGKDLTNYVFAEGDKLEIIDVSGLAEDRQGGAAAGNHVIAIETGASDNLTVGGLWQDYYGSINTNDGPGAGRNWRVYCVADGADTYAAEYVGPDNATVETWRFSPVVADTEYGIGYGLWVKFGDVTHSIGDDWLFRFFAPIVEMGVYEVHSKPTATTVRVKGNPCRGDSRNVTNTKVAYRIVSKNYLNGVPAIMSSPSNMDASAANGLLYIADGSDRMMATNGTGSRLSGIAHPPLRPGNATQPPIDTLPQYGSLSGTAYGRNHNLSGNLKFTFYDLFTATESLQSEETEGFTANLAGGVGDWRIKIIGSVLEGGADSRATHVRWYVKRNVAEETEYKRVGTLPLPLDNSSGEIHLIMTEIVIPTLHVETLDAVKNSLPPKKAVILEWHRDRMWYCKDNSTQVFASEAGVPDYVSPINSFHAGRADGQKVTALVSGKSLLLDQVTDTLVVLKERSIYTFTETAALTEIKIDKVGDVGCGGHMATVVDENGVLYFGGERGIHRWRGGDVEDLHYAIQNTYFGYDMSNLNQMALTIDVQEGLLLVAMNTMGGAQNDKILVMNYRKEPIQGPRGVLYEWTIWDLAATSFAIDTEDGLPKLRFGISTGQIATYRGDAGTVKTDNGSGITWNWNGPKLHLNSQMKKRWYYLGATIEKQATTSDILVGHRLNEATTSTTQRFDQSQTNRILHKAARRGEYLMPVFSAQNASEVTRILNYEVAVEEVGRR